MTGKHTHAEGRERLLRSVPPLPDPAVADEPVGLPAPLAEKVDGYVVRFAAQLRQGVMAASVAIGLEVLDELMAAEVDELAGPKGKHDPDRRFHPLRAVRPPHLAPCPGILRSRTHRPPPARHRLVRR